MEGRVPERPERLSERLLERSIHLDDMKVRDARGEVLGEHAQAAAHL